MAWTEERSDEGRACLKASRRRANRKNSVRMRLTMLYVGLFLASAAALLTITYFLVEQRLPQVTTTANGAVMISGSDSLGAGVAAACDPAAAGPAPSSVAPGQLNTCRVLVGQAF